MEPLFLAVAICFNPACTDQQIFIADKFPPIERVQCEKAATYRRELLAKSGVLSSRVACKTQRQLEREGV